MLGWLGLGASFCRLVPTRHTTIVYLLQRFFRRLLLFATIVILLRHLELIATFLLLVFKWQVLGRDVDDLEDLVLDIFDSIVVRLAFNLPHVFVDLLQEAQLRETGLDL